jgi:predicted esterase
MKSVLYILFFLLFVNYNHKVVAQNDPCNSERYRTKLFERIDSTMGVKYGTNITMNNKSQDLFMDIFEPADDNTEIRPLILMIHGGGFFAGDKDHVKHICRDFAKRGFVSVSINYRLIDVSITDSSILNEGVIMAINDAKSALQYLVKDAAQTNKYKIDTSHIFVGGESAGAITALHLAYLDENDSISPHLHQLLNKHDKLLNRKNKGFTIKGVINYSGALLESTWINKGEAPLFSVHDENDSIVPFKHMQVAGYRFPMKTYGSYELKTIADKQQVLNYMYLLPNSNGHVSFIFNPDSYEKINQMTADFLSNIICKDNAKKEINLIKTSNTNKIKLKTEGFKLPFEFILFNSYGEMVIETKIKTQNKTIKFDVRSSEEYFYSILNSTQTSSGKIVVK